MPLKIKSTDRICVCGLPDSGKTYFMKYLCSLVEPDIYIIDPLNQYEQFGEVGDIREGKKRWIPREESPQELEEISKRLWQISNITLVMEEAEQYIPQGRPIPQYTSGLIRMGRNWGIGIWATTRRIQDINKRFFDLAQHVFFYRCGFKSREYIAAMIGNEYVYPHVAPKLNKTGFTITTLPQYHALHFDLENETASIITLKLGARETIAVVSKESDAPVDKEKMREIPAEEEPPVPAEEEKAPTEEEGDSNPRKIKRGAKPWHPRR